MALKSNALISVDELISSMEVSKAEVKVATISIYNSSSDCTDATILKSGNILTLVVNGGVNAHNTSIDLSNASYDTISKLVAHILSLNKGWVVQTLCSGDFNSVDIYNIPSKSVKGEALELALTGFNRLMLEEFINSASAFIQTYCNRTFIQANYTEYIDGNGSQMMLVKNFPISNVTIKEWDYMSQSELATLVEHTDFEVFGDEGMIYAPGIWGCGIKNFKVSYTGGYLLSDLPEDLKNACKEIAKLLYNARNKQGIASENDGARTITFERSASFLAGVPIPASIIAMLIPYARQDTI